MAAIQIQLNVEEVQKLIATDSHYHGWRVETVDDTGALLSKRAGERQTYLPVSTATLQKLYDKTKPKTVKLKG